MLIGHRICVKRYLRESGGSVFLSGVRKTSVVVDLSLKLLNNILKQLNYVSSLLLLQLAQTRQLQIICTCQRACRCIANHLVIYLCHAFRVCHVIWSACSNSLLLINDLLLVFIRYLIVHFFFDWLLKCRHWLDSVTKH